MKPGVVGTVLVVLAGGVGAGALVLRDRSALQEAARAQAAGQALLQSGEAAKARQAYRAAAAHAARVGGLSGLRAEALDLSQAAREGLRLLDALQAAEEDPLPLLRLLEADGIAAPDSASRADLLRAGLVVDAARALEDAGAERQAVRAYAAAVERTRAAASPRLAEAERGRRRLVVLTSLRDAEEALRGRAAARAAALAHAAGQALQGPSSPFEHEAAERVAALQRRVTTLEAEAADVLALDAYRQALDALHRRVDSPELGRLLPAVEALTPPALSGGHPRASALQEQLAGLEALHAKLRTTAAAYQGMVLALRRGDGVAVFIDRLEVTNAEYAEFMADGGYARAELWSAEGQGLRARFRDATGEQGPRTWREGAPAPGTEQHPVSGVGSFEAGAFARWKSAQYPDTPPTRLPTIDEWRAAAAPPDAPYPWGDEYLPERANLDTDGPVAVGSYPAGAAPSGALDMIGNVREIVIDGETRDGAPNYWTVGGAHFSIPGGVDVNWQYDLPSTDRSAGTGFRCAKELQWN